MVALVPILLVFALLLAACTGEARNSSQAVTSAVPATAVEQVPQTATSATAPATMAEQAHDAEVVSLAIDPSDSSTLYAATRRGLFESTDGAQAWSRLLPGDAILVGVDPAAPSTVYAVGSFGLMRTHDGGLTWTDLNDEDTPGFVAGYVGLMWFDTSFTPSAVCTRGPEWTLLRSTDLGKTWRNASAGLRVE